MYSFELYIDCRFVLYSGLIFKFELYTNTLTFLIIDSQK